ncbi:hypothetical protein SDC9_81525 [bioreactor metagenome]|uniref:Uncharacterized protein n=1 Tax=bioreactor metagenome TaxID=1076179 RepID=A0A644Z213_9ZZZZ
MAEQTGIHPILHADEGNAQIMKVLFRLELQSGRQYHNRDGIDRFLHNILDGGIADLRLNCIFHQNQIGLMDSGCMSMKSSDMHRNTSNLFAFHNARNLSNRRFTDVVI